MGTSMNDVWTVRDSEEDRERERKRKRDEIIEEKSAMSEGTKMEKDEHTNE
jgi:hypothetical protein